MRPSDVHLSARRFFAELLGPDWTTRAEERRTVLPDDERPFAAVVATSPVATSFARATVPQGDVRRSLSLTAVLYPLVLSEPRLARAAAADLADLADRALLLGVVVPGPPERSLSAPLTLPLWDYGAVPVEGPARAAAVLPLSSASIEDHGARAIRDEEDDRRWTVAVNLRVSWWSGGRDRPVSVVPPVTAGVPGSYSGEQAP